MVTVRIPMPSSMLLVNLLGVFGLLGIAVAVGGLAHNWWWSLAVASAEAVALSIVGALNQSSDEVREAPGSAAELATVRSRTA